MARKRVTGRFYVFLMLVAALVLFLFRDSIFGASEVVNVLDGAASDVRSAQAKFALLSEYGLLGLGYWNFMRPFTAGFSLQNYLFTASGLG